MWKLLITICVFDINEYDLIWDIKEINDNFLFCLETWLDRALKDMWFLPDLCVLEIRGELERNYFFGMAVGFLLQNLWWDSVRYFHRRFRFLDKHRQFCCQWSWLFCYQFEFYCPNKGWISSEDSFSWIYSVFFCSFRLGQLGDNLQLLVVQVVQPNPKGCCSTQSYSHVGKVSPYQHLT